LVRFVLALLIVSGLVFVSCDEDDEPLQRQPIEIHQPDSLIVLLPADTTVPLELELFLPADVDSLSAKFQIGRSVFTPLFTKSYPGTTNNETYNGELTIPDSLQDGTMVRYLFTAFDENDSTYMKTLRVDIEND